MPNEQTAFFKNNIRKAKETEGEPFGLAPFLSFLQDFNSVFSPRTRPSFHKRAQQYLSGLFQLDRRRNIEKIDEKVLGSEYQSMHHFLTNSPWDGNLLCAGISKHASQLLGGSSDSCLMIDPSGIPKKGRHSVGVSRQYCGNVGKVDNCQVGVFAALAKGSQATLINKKLYLPKEWCDDSARCDAAGVPPQNRVYKTRPQLALELIDEADKAGVTYNWIGMDAEFGNQTMFSQLDQRGKKFLIDVRCNTQVYQSNPRLTYFPKAIKGRRLRLKQKATRVDAILNKQSKKHWRKVHIKNGTKGSMYADFIHKKVWLWDGCKESKPIRVHLIVRKAETKDSGRTYKYSLSNAPLKTTTQNLAYRQSQRFWIEQAIKEAKDTLGMDEYQARKWRAWDHHVSLVLLAALYILKLKLDNKEEMPLISVTDIREILEFLFPSKVQSLGDLMVQIRRRQHRRKRATDNAQRRLEGLSPPQNRSEHLM